MPQDYSKPKSDKDKNPANPLSLALIRQKYTPFGGSERFLSRAMSALQADGVKISVLTRDWQGTESDGYEEIRCAPAYLGRLWRDWSFANSVRDQLTNRSFDLVQSHERVEGCDLYRAGDGVHAEWLRQRGRSKSDLNRLLTSLSPYHRFTVAQERRMFESAMLSGVICNSQMVKDEILSYYNISANKLHVIYSGVDKDKFSPDICKKHRKELRQKLAIPEDSILYLFVGSGFQRKGVPVLLEAMAHLPDNCSLIVVGKDKNQTEMQQQAQRLGLGNRVQFTGGIKDVIPYYGAADVFVLPTLYDPFPNVVLEAMSVGLPVITSLKCGAIDLIEHGNNGLLGDAMDCDLLVANMKKLFDPELRKKMGRKGRKTVQPLTLKAMSSKLLDLYNSLLGR
ncbi:MAG: glycosyltransferase family 4 protein [Magnetococcales bacterium]|nr:glycosyltransferase family 4 protein [Magnetococcales bacterium]